MAKIGKSALIVYFALACSHYAAPSFAKAAKKDQQKINAKLVCGPHSADPEKWRAFQANMVFTLSENQLQATRQWKTGGNRGQVVFNGTVSPVGGILVSGKGFDKYGSEWVYEFAGYRNENGDTTLVGELKNTNGAIGSRDCQLIFFKPRSPL